MSQNYCCEHGVWGPENSWVICPFANFQDSRANRCSACAMLLEAVDNFQPGWTREDCVAMRSIRLRHTRFLISVTLLEDEDEIGAFYLIRSSAEDPFVCTGETRNRILHQIDQITSHSMYQKLIEDAKGQVSKCVEQHEGCKHGNSTFIPRRLLQINISNKDRQIFLLEPTEPVQYVSLSYCWGPDAGDVLKTTSRNIESHFQRLPFSLVPQTIRDAMTICWELGIRYMWVDSLCIIQDDPDDWLCESSKMMDIYAFSHFTLTLKEPASCKLGFLWALLLEKSKPIQLPRQKSDEELGTISMWYTNSLPRRSLDERAWCLQESVLPNRTLAFSDKEMEWGCLQNRNEGTMLGDYVLSLKTALGQGFGPGEYRKRFDLDGDWRDVVEEYSNRTLSQEADKLTAISGLATIALKAQFEVLKSREEYISRQTETGQALFGTGPYIPGSWRDIFMTSIETAQALSSSELYVAGLWRSSFVSGLAWSVNEHKLRPGHYEKHKRQSKYRAPTWSWASIDGPVWYTERDTVKTWKYRGEPDDDIKVEELKCTPLLASNPTGPVSAGFAIVTGPLVEVQLAVLDTELSSTWISTHQKIEWEQPAVEKRISVVRDKKLRTFKVYLDLLRDPTIRVNDPNSRDWVRGQSGLRSRGWFLKWKNWFKPESAKFEVDGTRFFCLQIFTWHAIRLPVRTHTDGYGNFAPETWFLVLQESKMTIGAYERVGIGSWRGNKYIGGVGDYECDCSLFENCERSTIKIV